MKKTEQIKQISKLIKRIDMNTNVDAGCFYENPTSRYTDQALAQREWDTFFCNSPQLVGLSGDLPDIYSFFTVKELGTPILAVRDSDGLFRAFVNSCRHRGVVVEEEERGTSVAQGHAARGEAGPARGARARSAACAILSHVPAEPRSKGLEYEILDLPG